jgi:hypothetical protein
MKTIACIAIYIFIGIGVTAAAEERSGITPDPSQRSMSVMIWPGIIAAMAYTKWTEPEVSCTPTIGGPDVQIGQ